MIPFEAVFYGLTIWQSNDLHSQSKYAFGQSEHVSVLCWSGIGLVLVCFEVTGWIEHYDRNGSVKYRFYCNFYYGGQSTMQKSEKHKLVQKMRSLSTAKWTKVLGAFAKNHNSSDQDDKKAAIGEIASMLSEYLSDLDLTPSDILMGLFILQWQSMQWIGGKPVVHANYVLEQTNPVTTDVAEKVLTSDTSTPKASLDKHWLHISRLRQYAHFVNASYGWIQYLAVNMCNCTAYSRLCDKLSCRNKTAPERQRDLENGIQGPGGCLCAGKNAYLAAFLEMSGLHPNSVLLFEFSNTFYDATVMLVIDDLTQAIVIIVRGTLSSNETLVDMLALGEPLRQKDHELPPEERFIAHGGMIRVARALSEKILREGWVEKARISRPDYPLVMCGHSLGAGLVSLMSVLLRTQYPELKAYAFEPPGALMNEKLSEYTRDFLVSTIYGFDVVGRLGVATLEDLRARVMHALVVCNVSKTRIMFGRIARLICRFLFPRCKLADVADIGRFLSSEVKAKLLDPDLDDVYNSPIGASLKDNKAEVLGGVPRVNRLLETDRSIMNWKKPEARKLLRLSRSISRKVCCESEDSVTIDKLLSSLPDARCGARVLFITKVDGDFEIPGVPMLKKRGYEPPPVAVWADASNFNSILVHPRMLSDHSPIPLCTAFDHLYATIESPDKVFPKFPLSTYARQVNPLSGLSRHPEEQEEKYCRVRQLKINA
ncbi:hypothetical protein SprV_0501817600 [Sparganum proliferum]